jgi:hypothetical protein
MSVRGSAAPPDTRARMLTAIDAWLAEGEIQPVLDVTQGEPRKAAR